MPEAALPPSLRLGALACLRESDPAIKCVQTALLHAAAVAGEVPVGTGQAIEAPSQPGRPERPLLVAPRALAQRGLGSQAGRAALVHAVAHIEFNAINLAWDAVARFPGLPEQYYLDWASVAADEARHFLMLRQRLAEMGQAYGDLPAHNGLWEMALLTADDHAARMALVPRVLEARGLDVTPPMIDKLRHHGDHTTVACLEVILQEEVGHVAIGTRWFNWACRQRGVEPEATFRQLVSQHAAAAVRGPFNRVARQEAGFSAGEMAWLEARAPRTAA